MSSFTQSQPGGEVCLFSDANSLGGRLEGEATLRPLIIKSMGPAPVLNSPVPPTEGAGGFWHCANHRTRCPVSRRGSGGLLPVLSMTLGKCCPSRNPSVMTPEGGEVTTTR